MDFNNSSIPISQLLSDGSSTYLYVLNYPVLLADPSGEIAPLLLVAGLGGLISAGINLAVQLHHLQPHNFYQALRCVNWSDVAVAFGAGAEKLCMNSSKYSPNSP